MSNQITQPIGYNAKNMIFSKPMSGEIPNSNPKIQYKRINIKTRYDDGGVGDLIIPTCEGLFSFGVSENRSPETGKISGHVMPLCLWTKDAIKDEERQWVESFNSMVDRCKEHILENKESIEQWDLDAHDLKKLNPLYWKKDKGKIVEGTGPILYAKLMKKDKKISTIFYDEDLNHLKPEDLANKRCFVKGAIRFESIFIGNKISLQVKLYEAEVRIVDTGMKSLLRNSKLKLVKPKPIKNELIDNGDDEKVVDEVSEEEAEVVEETEEQVEEEEEEDEPDPEEIAPPVVEKKTRKYTRRSRKKN